MNNFVPITLIWFRRPQTSALALIASLGLSMLLPVYAASTSTIQSVSTNQKNI